MRKLILIIAFIAISISVFCQNTEITYGAKEDTWWMYIPELPVPLNVN